MKKVTGSLITLLALVSITTAQAKDKKQTDFESLQKQVEQHIRTFDDLDFNRFSNQANEPPGIKRR